MKKFDFCIGNPPYQEENTGNNEGFASPVYHKFLDAAYNVAEKVEMIHPARFLFDAGSTPKAWNEKMLSDEHLKVLDYQEDASEIFSNTIIKGGVAITYRDPSRKYGAIGIFSKYDEVNSIRKKVVNDLFIPLSSVMENQTRFDLEALYSKHPELKKIIGSDGRDKRFRNNIFDKVSLFSRKEKPGDIAVLGVVNNKREWRYFPERFVDFEGSNLNSWKVAVVRVNGTGALGEVLSAPVVLAPKEGYTQTFIGIGAYDNKSEAENTIKYVKTKLLRTLLSVYKATQDNSIEVWRAIPVQDFTSSSDIDWSQSISEIDQQLYEKYGLTNDEIGFIETHVKEMN